VNSFAADGFKALDEKNGGEATPRGLVGDVPLVVLDADRRVVACLRDLRKKGLVKRTRPPGSLGLWEIIA
jgi:hypothetical protein